MIVFWRVAFGPTAVLVYLAVTGKIKDLACPKRRTTLALLAVGGAAVVAANWMLFVGERWAQRPRLTGPFPAPTDTVRLDDL
ncbi:MAG: hypothetical protein ABH877_00895 [bacterium]